MRGKEQDLPKKKELGLEVVGGKVVWKIAELIPQKNNTNFEQCDIKTDIVKIVKSHSCSYSNAYLQKIEED